VLLVGIDTNGTRLITSPQDPLFKTEVTNFLVNFISNLYNFNSKNFKDKVGQATALMSESLWANEREKLLSLMSRVEKENISISGEILKIVKNETGAYIIDLNVKEESKLKVKKSKIQLKINVAQTARTKQNPWGMEVVNVDDYAAN